jgi:methylated-DNA-[protein]-cysteine S-methyltransferase
MIYTNDYESPLGNILLAGDEQGLTGLWFTDGGRYIGLGLKKDAVRRETDYFAQTKKWLDIYFSGRDPGFFPQIHLVGSDFRNRVGEIMCGIPYGKTVTYGWIAEQIAKERGQDKMSAQAVGGAVGHNPICIIVPCHRVVGSNGSLTGYGGGILRKKALLELEGNDLRQFTLPGSASKT